MSTGNGSDAFHPRGRWLLLLFSASICALVVSQVALAGDRGDDGPSASASAGSKQVKKLRQQVARLGARIAALEARPDVAGGAAGGDLTGTYPNPLIGPDAVGAAEVVNDSLGAADVDESGLDTSILQARLAPGIPFPCSANNGAMYNVIQSGGVGCTSAVGNTKVVKVTFTGIQSIPSGTSTAVNFTQEDVDSAALHDNATNPHQLVASASGVYLVTGDVELAGSAAGTTRALCIVGQAPGQAEACVREPPSSAFNHRMSVSTIALLAAGQFVTLQVFQDSGGALNVTGDGVTEFSMVRISAGTLPGSAVTGL